MKALRGNFGKDFPAILGLTNKSSTWELWQRFSCHPWTVEQKLYRGNCWQRFSCHPWTDEQKLYVGTLAKIFLPSLDWRMKALRGNFGKDFSAILGLTNKSSTWELWQRFSCHPWTDEQKLYVGTLAKIILPSLDWLPPRTRQVPPRSRQVHAPVNRMKDRCKNITLAKTSVQPVISISKDQISTQFMHRNL